MTFTRTRRHRETAYKPASWLRAWSVLLLAVILMGPATGLGGALHNHVAHSHTGDRHAPIHDCVVCQVVRTPLATSTATSSVEEPTQVEVTHDQPPVSTGWLCLVLVDARGPPLC